MTILLVNNDRNQQEIFNEIIRRIDRTYTCLKAFSTESAMELLLAEDRVLPDMIFLDLIFRGESGKDMLETLKSSDDLERIPVCIYTDSTSKSDRDETSALGAIDYIVSSQNLTSLSASVKSVIERVLSPSIS